MGHEKDTQDSCGDSANARERNSARMSYRATTRASRIASTTTNSGAIDLFAKIEVARPLRAFRWLALAFLAAGVCGCAHSSRDELSASARIAGSHPPGFLIGPMSALLTNAENFSAHIQKDSTPPGNAQDFPSGQLLSRGSKVLFLPDYESKKARIRAGGVTIVFDIAEGQGTVMSEALQSYAPFTLNVRPTNVIVSVEKGSLQKIENHLCQSQQTFVQMSDGSGMLFHVLRATDLKYVPMQISSVSTSAPPVTLSLSKIRFEALPLELFSPPDGFTKYSSAEAMMDELAVRQGSLRRRNTESLTAPEPSNSPYTRPR
jgi:hypothetical protein